MRRQRILLVSLIVIGLVFAELVQYGTGFAGKTLWDWLDLLIVPAALALGGYLIQQGERSKADDRLKEQTLHSYLDRMSELLLKGHFDKIETETNARTVASARTLTTLPGLDGKRKGILIQFLYKSELINGNKAMIDLSGADFSHANLENMVLMGAHLENVNLTGANLKEAKVFGCHLEGANLTGASIAKDVLEYMVHKSEHTILPNGSPYEPPALPSQPPPVETPPDDEVQK